MWWGDLHVANRWLVVVGLVAGLQAASYGLTRWPFSFLPSLAPRDPGSLQDNLWLVLATLVGVSLPLLLVILQFPVPEDIAALPLTEVLRKRTHVDQVLVLSGFVVLHCGADALWFAGQAVLLFDFFVGLVLLIAMLGRSYWRLFELVRSHAELKNEAANLLADKLVDAIDASWVEAEANRRLIGDLEAHHVSFSPFTTLYQPPDWTPIGPVEPALLRDVDVVALGLLVDELLTPSAGRAPAQSNQLQPPRAELVLLRTCGQQIGGASPFMAYRTPGGPGWSAQDLWDAVAPHLRTERADD